MRFVFVMDPLERVLMDKDTTVGFLLSADARGHQCFHCLLQDVAMDRGEVTASVRPLRIGEDRLSLSGPARQLPLSDVDAVFIRKDPPFDAPYYYATLLLEHLRGRTVVMNDPRGLREANEKLYTLFFRRWMPETLISADPAAIFRFIGEIGGAAVIKPLDGAGGYGVLAVREDDRNASAIVDMLTAEGKQLAMVQQYLPQILDEGDKRVLLLDGQLLGAILRVPREGELRANIHVGGVVKPTELTADELVLVADIAPRLQRDGLYFVGLDLIAGKLTEINVTSPTGIRELDSFSSSRPCDHVIEWVEQRALGHERA